VTSIASGADGTLWLTQADGQIVRFALDGTTTLYPTPTPVSDPVAITAGPDGNLWFIEELQSRVGQVVLNAPEPATLNVVGGGTINATEGTKFSNPVASFSPAKPDDTTADYVARIDWGDGTTTIGTVVADGQGNFDVTTDHVFEDAGSYSATVTVI